MSTVIDALVLTLGLDASKFVKGQKEAEASLKKTKESAAAHGKEIEGSMKAATEGVSKLTKEFLGLFAIFTGGKAVKDFISDVTKSDANLGRFANNLKMSTKDLQSWQGAVESVGGAASDVTSSVQGLSDSFQALKVFGDPGIVRAIAVIGSRGGKRIDINKPINQTLLDLSTDLSKIAEKDPAQASYLGRQIGLTQSLYNVIVKGPAVVQKMLDAQAKYAASTADIDAAEKRQSAWQRLTAAGESFGRTVLTMVTPALMRLNELLRQFVEWAKSQLPAIQKAFEETFGSWDEILANIEKTLGKPNWKEWFEAIKGLGKDIQNVVQWFGGWKNTLELLLGLAVMNWLSPIVTAFGLLTGYILSLVGAGPALAALFAVGGPLAALGALYGLVKPTPANEGEDERARQQKYGQHGSDGGGSNDVSGDEGNKKPGENGTPWNHQTGGPPAELIKPHGDKMPSFDEFQKSLAAKPASHNDDYKGPSSANLRNKRAGIGERYDQAMRVAMDQLRQEGIPEANLHAAAAIMVGNASAESELVPQTVHDQGTGYGIYGARSERRSAMFRWLAANGYDRNSLIGQQRYMAIEAHRRGGRAWNALRNATPENIHNQGREFEAGFEAPARINNRNAQINEAYRHGVPGRASGGPVDAGSPYLVGEHGPELLIPAKSGHIFSHDDMAELWAAARAKSRMNLLKGIHPMATKEGIRNAYLQYRNAIYEHRKVLKEKRELELWKRQGEANTGGSSKPGGYGFKSPPGTLGKFSHDKGIIPRHTWQRHFLPDRGVNPHMDHWWGNHLQSASLGAGHHINSHNTNASHEVHVGAVNVHTAATDASGIVRDIKPALERASFASLGNYSLA